MTDHAAVREAHQTITSAPATATPTPLEHSILRTIRYFDLFAQPLTTVQIWRSLIVADDHDKHFRWAGQRLPRLHEVRDTLQTSAWLASHLETQWGYYALTGKKDLIPARLVRHAIAQQKWKLTQRIVRWLRLVPFVRLLAISGSLATAQPHAQSDLDLLVVTAPGRIWSARLGLLLVTQLLGRRRHHWHRHAPDKICLNHYLTADALTLVPEIRNLYTALLYQRLIPLTGAPLYETFQQANARWIKRFVMYPAIPALPAVQTLADRNYIHRIQATLEWVVGATQIERWAERLQRRTIAQHTAPDQHGRITLSPTELAFHPDTKVPGLLDRFRQDEGQRTLL